MVEIIYEDETVELVERCFAVQDAKGPIRAFVAQRVPGAKLKWLKPDEVAKINVDVGLAKVPTPKKFG